MGTGGTGGIAADGGMEDAADASDASDANACGAVESVYPIDPSPHVAACSPIAYPTNPPTSGPHYPYWAAFKTYTVPIMWGFLVHSMEHGGIIFAYNCPSGCAADVQALQAYIDALPADDGGCLKRFIIVPDPMLDVPFAAAAWGATLKMQCIDLAAIDAFVGAHYAKAPENLCFDGVDVSDPVAAGVCQPNDAGSD
jgi:hypothetical protein